MEPERVEFWPGMTKESGEKMIQHEEDSNVLENNRRRKRKESEQKMDQCEQIYVLVKLNMCLVLRDIFVDINIRFCEKIVNQIKL